MNFTNTCSAQNSGDTEINNLAQSIFIVLSFCSVISNIVIYSDKILENNEINKKFKSINNTYSVLKEYFFNNYKEDNNGNIIFENNIEIPDKVPVPPDSKKIERDIKELLNYQSPPPSAPNSKSVKKEIQDFLNSDDEDDDKNIDNIKDKKDYKKETDDNNLKHYHTQNKNEDKVKKYRSDEKNRDDKKHKKRDESITKNIKVKKSNNI
jgi:hypothetical protein